MPDMKDLQNWADQNGSGPHGGGDEPPAESHQQLDECAQYLREKAQSFRQMETIEGVDLADLAQKADDLADELEDASKTAEEAEAEEGSDEPDGDETDEAPADDGAAA